MKHWKHKIALALVFAALAALLAGCGSSYYASDNGSYSGSGSTTVYAPEAAYDTAEYGYAKADGDSGWTEETQLSSEPSGVPANVKIIYTADISLESTEFDDAAAGLQALVAENGGWYESSYLDNRSTYRSASYTVRIPAGNFFAFCEGVGSICQVNSLQQSSEDVSEFYYDTESRLVTQRTKLARLQDLLAQAEDMEDIITLESAISETELAIERLTGTLRHYDSLVGYSTIQVSLREVYKLTEVEEPVIGFGAKLSAAFRSGSNRLVNGFENFLLGFADNWAGWLILILILAAVAFFILRAVKKGRERKAAMNAARAQMAPPRAGAPTRTAPVPPAASAVPTNPPSPAAPKAKDEKK